MKKLGALLFFYLVFPFLLRSNPFPPPPYISEIYFEGDEWFIELVLWDFHSDLDNYRIVCSSDTAQFKPGIDITNLGWMIITQDSMLSPLSINKLGDFIEIEQEDNGSWWPLGMPVYFGDIEYSGVNYPYEGQSIVNTIIYDGYYDDYYWPVKENSPTLGSSFFQATTVGILAGRVLDQNLDPVGGIKIKYCNDDLIGQILQPIFTGDDGFFAHIMFARNYEISLMCGGTSLMDTSTFIEPDSTTWCYYYLDTLVGVPIKMKSAELSFGNFPNPFSDYTTFVLKIPEGKQYQEGRIIMYDMNGKERYNNVIKQETVGIVPVFHRWDISNYPHSLPPGEYISCLVLDGVVVAKTKSICIR